MKTRLITCPLSTNSGTVAKCTNMEARQADDIVYCGSSTPTPPPLCLLACDYCRHDSLADQ